MNASRFIELLGECGEEARAYSGRGMYGEECVGVKPFQNNDYALAADMVRMAENDDERYDLSELWRQVCEDQIGRGIILYWPGLKWPGDEESDEESNEECED